MAQTSVKLNGNLFDITTMSVTANGVLLPKGIFDSIDYKGSRESGMMQGNQTSPLGYTGGYAKGTGSFKMLKSYFKDFADQFIQLGYPDVIGPDFDIELSYLVNQYGPNPTNDSSLVKLIGCRIQDYDVSNAKGNDPIMVSCTLIIHRIIDDGNSLFGQADDTSV